MKKVTSKILFLAFVSMFFVVSGVAEEGDRILIKRSDYNKYLKNKYKDNYTNAKYFYKLDEIETNLLSYKGSDIIIIGFKIGLKDEKLLDVINEIKPVITDIVIKTLGSKVYDEVATAKGKEILSYEIAEKINETAFYRSGEKIKQLVEYIFIDKFLMINRYIDLEERIEKIEKYLNL